MCRKWSTYGDSWIHRTFPRKRYKDQSNCTGHQVQPRLTGEDPALASRLSLSALSSCSHGRWPAASSISSCSRPPPSAVTRLAPLCARSLKVSAWRRFSQLLPFFPDHFSFPFALVTFSKASVVFLSQFCVKYHQKNKSYAGEGLVLSGLGVRSAAVAVVSIGSPPACSHTQHGNIAQINTKVHTQF